MIKVSNDEGGAIEARCMIRLPWDGDRSVLFKDYIYPSPGNPEMSKAIDRMARQKARELGVPLIETPLQKDSHAKAYPKAIHSLGGNVPYEYSDWIHDVVKDGKYTISSAFIMYDPEKDITDSVKAA